MTHTDVVLSPAEATRQLGVSSKALRLYEERGLVRSIRNEAGWRHYGPSEIVRVRQVIALRALGLSLKQIGAMLTGAPHDLAAALAEHQARLETNLSMLVTAIERIRDWRNQAEGGQGPSMDELTEKPPALSLALPWPWNGELFEMRRLAPVTYLVGPLGSGKTRLSEALARAAGGTFVTLEREAPQTITDATKRAIDWLIEDGATPWPALTALMAALMEGENLCVVDLVEHGLDEPSQLALGAWLRRRGEGERQLVVMTRSSAVLDLEAVTAGHAILYCPANHTPPFEVLPMAGTPGFEGVANCLGTPEARARLANKPMAVGA